MLSDINNCGNCSLIFSYFYFILHFLFILAIRQLLLHVKNIVSYHTQYRNVCWQCDEKQPGACGKVTFKKPRLHTNTMHDPTAVWPQCTCMTNQPWTHITLWIQWPKEPLRWHSPYDSFVTVEHHSLEEQEKETLDTQTESWSQTLEGHCNINRQWANESLKLKWLYSICDDKFKNASNTAKYKYW